MEPVWVFCNRVLPRIRGLFYRFIGQPHFRRRGVSNKIFGWDFIQLGRNVNIGSFCWIEAVRQYGGQKFDSCIVFGNCVSISDLTHISAASLIEIGDGCLIGSKVYIGDHSHGDAADSLLTRIDVPPGRRALGSISPIYIGKNCWICDGAVILAGSKISAGSLS